MDFWSSPTVHQMLHNQDLRRKSGAGDIRRSAKDGKDVAPEIAVIVVENTHEPIIDMETFETVQMMLKERTRSGAKGEIHPLAKKIVCGCCGSFMEQTGRQPRADGTQRRYVRLPNAPARTGSVRQQDLYRDGRVGECCTERIRVHMRQTILTLKKLLLPEQDDPIQQREQARRDELKRLKSEADRRRKAMQELYLDKV